MTDSEHPLIAMDADRRQPRTHLFVMATLYSNSGSIPVRVRNMSAAGALVESPDLPAEGTPVVLKRGKLQAAGNIVWKLDRKCGVAFSAKVAVDDWMAKQPGEQDRVDRIVSDFKANTVGAPDCPNSPQGTIGVDVIVAQLKTISSELGELGDQLADDLILVATHPGVQSLDICRQRIDRLVRQLEKSRSA